MTSEHLPRDDLAAALKARRELGPDYDDAFVEALAERIDGQLAARGAGRTVRAPRAAPGSGPMSDPSLVLAIVSLVLAVPLSGIAAGTSGIPGLVVVWAAIVLVNIVHTRRR